ncbi:hypothetical protein GQ457_18G014900 [Hibiscus cannabinus]
MAANRVPIEVFHGFIENNALFDLPLIGAEITWSNFRETTTMCRLDRVLATVEKFHSGPRPFKLFNHWMGDAEFNTMLNSSLKNLTGTGIGKILRGSKCATKS